jgi:hypothetical protein
MCFCKVVMLLLSYCVVMYYCQVVMCYCQVVMYYCQVVML